MGQKSDYRFLAHLADVVDGNTAKKISDPNSQVGTDSFRYLQDEPIADASSVETTNFYDQFVQADEYLEGITNPFGAKQEESKKLIDTMVPQDAVKFVRNQLAIDHGSDLARAFFSLEVRAKMENVIRQYILEHKLFVEGMNYREQAKFMIDEIAGLGPLEPLMKDDTLTEVMINGANEVIIERLGKKELTDIRFDDDEHVQAIARKMLNLAGATVTTANPICDARLPDSRINIVIPPVSRNGTTITIRKYPPVNMTEENMYETGMIIPEMFECLKVLVRGGANLIVAGGTGAGKTTFIKRLAQEIPSWERTLTIEDTEELRLKQLYPEKHIISLECRLTDNEETNIDLSKLLKSSLRMYPTRIIVGEVRSTEALLMIEALNTGHDGGISSLHSNSAPDAATRLVQMIIRSGLPLDPLSIGKMVSTAIDIIVYVEKLVDGTRRVTEIVELLGYDKDGPIYTELYKFDIHGSDDDGKILGEHIRIEGSHFSQKLIKKLLSKGVKREQLQNWVNGGVVSVA